jgi:thiol-disulfide isomerase/thioredoxin
MDLLTEEDVHKFTQVMDKILVALVSFQADWCGHCKNYKPKWESLKSTPGRKVPMITVSDKAKEVEPFASAKIKGFPSNTVFSGVDKSFSEFNDEEDGTVTNAIPNMHDNEATKTLLTTDPSKLRLAINNESTGKGTSVKNNSSESLVLTPSAKKSIIPSAKKVIEEKDTPLEEGMETPTPPNMNMDSMNTTAVNAVPANAKPVVNTTKTGGSLYQAMLRVVAGKGPTTRRKRGGRRANTAKRI